MFVKRLKILKGSGIIRDITFKNGLNFIVDETIAIDNSTGNSVGKTTVIKLIDFCLGADPRIIYTDAEDRKKEYTLVKNFLQDNNIVVQLQLVQDILDDNSYSVLIERNFLQRNKAIRNINGEKIPACDFENKLAEEIFESAHLTKPSFNQLIAHNIRYKDIRINNTFKYLDAFSTDQDYQFLFLFMFGCPFGKSNERIQLLDKLKIETSFKDKLEKKGTQNDLLMFLDTVNKEISKKEKTIKNVQDYSKYKIFIEQKNNNVGKINRLSTLKENLKFRIAIIEESISELNNENFMPDYKDIKEIYSEFASFNESMQVSFEQVVEYHNEMIKDRKKFIGEELKSLQKQEKQCSEELKALVEENATLVNKINEINCRIDVETLQLELSKLYEKKGEYETYIEQFEEINNQIKDINLEIESIDEELFSPKFQKVLLNKLNNFNDYFSKVSKDLYNEAYLVTFNIKENKKTKIKVYEFSVIYSNSYSTGKKQGEVLCFDLAYLEFARKNNLPTLDFLANDKKELLHQNQMIKLKDYLSNKKMQFICSIMKDKLPDELNKEEYICVKLKQSDKLFRIENN